MSARAIILRFAFNLSHIASHSALKSMISGSITWFRFCADCFDTRSLAPCGGNDRLRGGHFMAARRPPCCHQLGFS